VHAEGEPMAIEVADFLSAQTSSELEENAELVVNPVLLHIVNEARKREQHATRLAALQARRRKSQGSHAEEPLSPATLERLLAEEERARHLGGMPNGRRSINVLTEAGARFSPVANVADAHKAVAQANKRNARSIITYMQKAHAVDVRQMDAVRRRNAAGAWMPTASEKAHETQSSPWQNNDLKRATQNVCAARDARTMLRVFKRAPQYIEFRLAQIEREKESKQQEDEGVKACALEQVATEFAEANPDTEASEAEGGVGATSLGAKLTDAEVRDLEGNDSAGDGQATERRERKEFGSSRSTPPTSRRRPRHAHSLNAEEEAAAATGSASGRQRDTVVPPSAINAARAWKKKAEVG